MALELSELQKTRDDRGWTRSELERRSGVTDQTIFLIESGRVRNPKVKTALKLAKALGRPVEALFAPDDSSDEGESSVAPPPATVPSRPLVAPTPGDLTAPESRLRAEERAS